jgi:hypothetical protein
VKSKRARRFQRDRQPVPAAQLNQRPVARATLVGRERRDRARARVLDPHGRRSSAKRPGQRIAACSNCSASCASMRHA